jgi:hypothetical protein
MLVQRVVAESYYVALSIVELTQGDLLRQLHKVSVQERVVGLTLEWRNDWHSADGTYEVYRREV